MIHKKGKPITLFRSILLILCGTALLQGIIFLTVITASDTLDNMKKNDYEMLSERVDYRQKEIESILKDNIYDQSIYQGVIHTAQELYLSKFDQAEHLNEEMIRDLINVINSFKCTGSFIIFDKDQMNLNYYPTLYLRDSEPTIIIPDNGDITAVFGQSTAIKSMGITMDPIWTTSMDLSVRSTETDFYHIPLETAMKNPTYAMEDLGYWKSPFRISEDDYEIITYTMPIRDQNNTVLGIIGLEFSTDFLASALNYEELNSSLSNAYLLGILNEDGTLSQTLISGPAYAYLDHENIELEAIYGNTYKIKNTKEKTLGATASLDLYATNTPFVSQQWILLGMVSEQQLLNNVYSLQKTTYACIAVAVIAALIAAIWASYRFSNPIIQLRQRLKESSRTGTILLPRVNISEIDNLSSAIEDLSHDVAYASSRLSQILQIVDIQVGAVEYSLTRDHVFCTEMTTRLLEFDVQQENMTHYIFQQEIVKFKQKIMFSEWEEGNKDSDQQILLVKFRNKKEQECWLRIYVTKRVEELLLVINNVSDEIIEKKRLERERDHDALTNLLNRRAFKEHVTQMLETDTQKQGVMVMWDLDNLKYINDTYGHDIGDRYIRSAADVLGNLSSAHAITARMAGDEFLLYLFDYPSIKEYKKIIRNMHKELGETTLLLPDQSLQPIRASAGIAWYPQDGCTYDELLKHADYAMYDAKNTIKGSMKEFNPNSYDKDKILINGKEELNHIFEKDLVRFLYQPIVCGKTGDIFGYEALMRPISEHIKSPLDLFRLSKSQGKLYQMEWLTWKNVMKDYLSKYADFKERKLFINSIPNTALYMHNFTYLETICENKLQNIVIEIIESDDLDLNCMAQKQEFAKKHHIQFAVDDFGSGYNNEGMLLKITPDFIKIDMDIIQGVAKDHDREKLVHNLIQYAHSKHILVIAEGIENAMDLEVCIHLGVDLLQGYYLGRPGELLPAIDEKKKEMIITCHANKF